MAPPRWTSGAAPSTSPENPAAVLAWLLFEHDRRGRHNHVLMPYVNQLLSMADWYRQLWAESLGKEVDVEGKTVHAGPTPLKALGTTDQHSQVQLYREGPDDKVIGFVAVEDTGADVALPASIAIEPLSYLAGSTLGTLLDAERRATEFALAESRRPSYALTLPDLDERAIGEFIALWEITTAVMGRLLRINAYDQPAVETGKQATFGLMGRAGYESWAERVQSPAAGTAQV